MARRTKKRRTAVQRLARKRRRFTLQVRAAMRKLRRLGRLRGPKRYGELTRRERRNRLWLSKKIRILRREGYPQRQAVAIAFNMLRKKRSR